MTASLSEQYQSHWQKLLPPYCPRTLCLAPFDPLLPPRSCISVFCIKSKHVPFSAAINGKDNPSSLMGFAQTGFGFRKLSNDFSLQPFRYADFKYDAGTTARPITSQSHIRLSQYRHQTHATARTELRPDHYAESTNTLMSGVHSTSHRQVTLTRSSTPSGTVLANILHADGRDSV